jgi:N-acetyl-1-D-myo-inositol-2-amino-2-deoxy-alpha-D-glucopyranoside deacetylase
VTTKRLLLVHAHPDDESSQSAATMAKYVSEGAAVTLVTCTLGEYGDVVHPDLAHMKDAEVLGAHRLGELTEAMAAVGVTDFVRLGGDGTYHDSGMIQHDDFRIDPGAERADHAFWDADLLQAALHLVPILRDRKPHVVITYNPFGGYGHPDHVQAHRVTMYAIALAGVPSYRPDLGQAWSVPRALWGTFCAEDWALSMQRAKERGIDLGWEMPTKPDPDAQLPPMIARRSDIAAHIRTAPWMVQQHAALSAHKSQVNLEDPFWSMMTTDPHPEALGECYLFAGGVPFPGGLTEDLFEGLDLT